MYMIMLVLDQPDRLDDVLTAWEEAGITGATYIESSGLFRRTKRRTLVPARYVMPGLTEAIERGNYTVFSIVRDEEQVQTALQATESVIGELSHPHTGVFTAWPLAVVKGIGSSKPQEGQE